MKNNNLTEIVFILDRSGSMSGLESDTIGGFNSMIEKQKREDGEAIVSTVLFDDQIEILHDRVNISKIEKMTNKDYYVRGCTALLDAVGSSIKHIKKCHKKANEDERPAKTIFIITTDGLENSSRVHSLSDVKQMIKKRKNKDNWEFIFLGANIDAIEVAGSMGIAASRAVNYVCDSVGTALNYKVLSNAVSRIRAASPMMASEALGEDEWKREIEEDYEERNR